ncbi:3-oxoacid CoA-transferase subunit B [Corynebacterium sp. HMSC068H04]|uniref:3-oxoacid CoA-transferase subunit B n=1 Tax=Corynebacterium sp. HMSC068H04 TaxID=1739296 RepID=UPI0009F1C260|nr:3-oxoacid CoA-transferase subunit B [Corynebacterium sp. HMSC068H04]
MAQVAAKELRDGDYVNLGIGVPTLIANNLPEGVNVVLQSENGILGMGPHPAPGDEDPDLINAGKQTITFVPGTSIFDSSVSFSMIRSGRMAAAFLGALEVSQTGDLANWKIPGKMIKGMGGAMDLVSGARRVVVLMDHLTKKGEPKLLKECTLPVTGRSVVNRVITNLGDFEIIDSTLILRALAPGVSEEEIRENTSADFEIDLRGDMV